MIYQQIKTRKISVKSRCFGLIPLLVVVLALCYPLPVEAKSFNAQFPEELLSARLKKIGELSDATILFDPKLVASTRVLSLNAENITVEQALDRTLSGTAFTWKKTAETSYAVLKKGTPPAKPQPSGAGRLSGLVTDEAGVPIPGAAIAIPGTGRGTITDVNGKYTLQVPAGKITIEVSFLSYQKKKITGVDIRPDKTTKLDVILSEASEQLSEVTVTVLVQRASAIGMLLQQKAAISMTDGISADLIRKTSDNNVAQVLTRLPGVTVNDSKHVVVRGMGERYNNMLLNGISLPSTEPNRKNFSFDIIPSSLVDNVIVAKTFIPDMSGEFVGGTVTVNTLSLPDKPFLKLSIGTGMNSISTGKDFYSTKRYDDDYFLGNPRDWYGTAWKLDEYNHYVFGTFIEDIDKAASLNAKIPNDWGMLKYKGQPTQSYSLIGGIPVDLKNGQKIGFTMALTYRHEENSEHIEQAGFRNPDRYMVGDMGDRYNFVTTMGGIANFKWQNPNHSLAWHNLYNNHFSHSNLQRVTFNENYANDITQYSSIMINQLLQSQLEGKHNFFGEHLVIDWTAGYSKVNRDQPEDRLAVGIISEKDAENRPISRLDNQYIVSWQIGLDTKIDNGHIRNTALEEGKTDAGANAEYAFMIDGKKQKIKAGYRGTFRRSDYAQQYLLPKVQLSGYKWNQSGGLTIHQLYDPENLASGKIYFTPYGLHGNVDDAYKGEQDLHAVYAMAELKPLRELTLIGGVRMEANDMRTITEIHNSAIKGSPYIGDSIVASKTTDWMPAASVIYEISPKINLKAAYSNTLARPDFRELAQIRYYDVQSRSTYTSFKAILPTHTTNADLRLEWYPAAGEIISLSGFYKKFKNPVETLGRMLQDGYNYTFLMVNLDQSESLGLEFNLRKSFGFFGYPFFNKLYLSVNAMVMKANVEYNYLDLTTLIEEEINPEYNRDRPLQGLAPYSINTGLTYEGNIGGFAVNYGRTGRKLALSGASASLDEYINPRDVLDLQVSLKVLKGKMEIKANAGDLLNPGIYHLQERTVEQNRRRRK